MTEEYKGLCIVSYIVLNLILFIQYKFTQKYKIINRFFSTIDNLLFCLLIGYSLYKSNPYLVILIPCILFIVYPISWGLNKELSDEELASLVRLQSPFPFSEKKRQSIKLAFARFFTFPFFYLLDSWSKS